jgi:hypothetical protein
MSNGEVTLALLGEQMRAMQSDVRRIDSELTMIRDKVVRIEAEQVEIREGLYAATGENVVRMTRLERRIDRLEMSLDARFRQIEETMATNVQVLLTAIQGRAPPD